MPARRLDVPASRRRPTRDKRWRRGRKLCATGVGCIVYTSLQELLSPAKAWTRPWPLPDTSVCCACLVQRPAKYTRHSTRTLSQSDCSDPGGAASTFAVPSFSAPKADNRAQTRKEECAVDATLDGLRDRQARLSARFFGVGGDTLGLDDGKNGCTRTGTAKHQASR
jgi:hypothetical protein